MANDVTVTFNGNNLGLLSTISQNNAALGSMQDATKSASAAADEHSSALGRFGSALGRVLEPLTNFAGQLFHVFETMALWRVMDQVTNAINEMTTAWFNLNEETEKNIYTWKYLLPGGMQTAQDMANWTKKFSIDVPYTRQDMLSAITTMAGLNMNEQQIQQYLPLLADLGATRAPGRSLTSIANIVAGAEYGRSMMLRYDLHIDPKELEKYGYVEGKNRDPSKFLPALQKWAQAHGYIGAAKDIAHETWWGTWSSFIDRIQNFQLDMGGKGFGEMKTLLNDISDWMDAHAAQISAVADALGGKLAGGIRLVAQAAGNFIGGASGDKKAQKTLPGAIGGVVAQGGADIWKGISSFAEAFSKSNVGASLTTMLNAIQGVLANSNVQKGISALGSLLGMALGTAINIGAGLITAIANAINFIAGNQTALDVVIGLLAGFAVVVIPPLVAGFIAWAIAAGGAAVATIAATWPILLIIAAVALLVTGIILLVQHWKEVSSWLQAEWGKICAAAQFIWGLITSTITNAFWSAVKWVQDRMNDLKNGIIGAWNWVNTNIVTPLSNIGTTISNAINGIIQNALQWGENLLSMLGQGIMNGLGGLKDKVGQVGSTIAGALGFHSPPKEGILSDSDTWMPNAITMWATGLEAGTPRMQQAMQRVAAQLQFGPGGTFGFAGGYGGAGGGTVYSGSTTYGGNSNYFYGASSDWIQQQIDAALAARDRQANLKARQAGGYRIPGGV